MGVINKTTEQINSLLEKVEGMPEEGVVGKTPVLETGTTTTLEAGSLATSEVVANGTDASGNPKYKLNFGIPKGQDGTSSGGGGVADSVQWNNVLNKPTWVNSATKPTYTATEVGALPATTTIPDKTSQLTNDSNFTTTTSFKTVNGQSIVGSGNIEISGTGSGIADAPSDGETYGRNNGNWVKVEAKVVNVYDLVIRVYQAAFVGTKITQEDYNTLIGYIEDGTSLYVYEDGNSGNIELTLSSDNIIIILKNPINNAGQTYSAFIISNTLDVTLSDSTFTNSEYIASKVMLKEYSKAETYTPITADDTINSAIGKLEAGIGSGGGSSDDEFVIENTNIHDINITDSEEVLYGYLGGEDNINEILAALKAKKRIIFKQTGDSPLSIIYSIQATAMSFFGVLTLILDIPDKNATTNEKRVVLKRGGNGLFIAHFNYLSGKQIPSAVQSLNTDSTDEDIKSVFPTSSLEELYKLANMGCKFLVDGSILANTKFYPDITVYKNGSDYTIFISIMNIYFFSDNQVMRVIQYTAASNTYEVQA